MKITCPNCQTKCEYALVQKIGSKECDLKVHFNIVELKCGSCGGKCMMSVKPSKISVFNVNRKIIEY